MYNIEINSYIAIIDHAFMHHIFRLGFNKFLPFIDYLIYQILKLSISFLMHWNLDQIANNMLNNISIKYSILKEFII